MFYLTTTTCLNHLLDLTGTIGNHRLQLDPLHGDAQGPRSRLHLRALVAILFHRLNFIYETIYLPGGGAGLNTRPSFKQLLDGEQRRGQAVGQDDQGGGGQGQGGGGERAEEGGVEEHQRLVQAQHNPTLG